MPDPSHPASALSFHCFRPRHGYGLCLLAGLAACASDHDAASVTGAGASSAAGAAGNGGAPTAGIAGGLLSAGVGPAGGGAASGGAASGVAGATGGGVGGSSGGEPQAAGAGSGSAGKPSGGAGGGPAQSPTSVIVILFDDVGYGDLGSFGGKQVDTHQLDKMAAEGTRFTSFYAQPVCTASRTALLTGSYPQRVSMPGVLSPTATSGLNPQEVTIADAVKGRGYATAMYGKWHLGRPSTLLPTAQGFDEYFGIPYSNDMAPHVMLENDAVLENDPADAQLTQRYTERAVQFIEKNRAKPFFLYLAHNMAHTPLGASAAFRGTTRNLYTDAVAELDWSVGQVRAALNRLGLAESTLLVVASDNGPWLEKGADAGSAGPLREGKFTTFEGGVRVPMLAAWPGTIPAGRVSDEPISELDLLPTIARVTGATLAADRKIDGKDLLPLLRGEPGAKSPHDALYFHVNGELQAVRSGQWKLHFPHSYKHVEIGVGGKPVASTLNIGQELFDLDADIGEKTDVAAAHPDVVTRLTALADVIRPDIGDSLTKTAGQNIRPMGK